MNDKNMAVLVNIIGAVESGGQVYGKRDYAGYAAPYANSPEEHTVTLGWAQNYGGKAKKLVQMIHDKDEAAFRKIDSGGSIAAMLKKDWVAARWKPTAAQQKALIALIDSPAGHECQDALFVEDAKVYIGECEKNFTKDVPAVMMFCEIRHLGGYAPSARIFRRLDGDYSLGAIMASLKKDQDDAGNDNQVGDKKYWSRHEACKEFIEKYAVPESEKEGKKVKYSRQKVVDLMKSWIGKKESDGSYKTIIDIYNSLESGKLPRGTKMDYSWAWCACTWSALAVKLGYTKIMPIEISCYYLIEEAKKLGCWQEADSYVPLPGDGVLYDWEDGPNYASTDNMGTPDHVGTVLSVNKAAGEMLVGEGNKDNAVATRTLKINGKFIRGFIVPKYTDNDVKDDGAVSQPEQGAGSLLPGKIKIQLETFLVGAEHPQVKAIQRILKALGYKGKDGKKLEDDGVLGENTAYAIERFQRDAGMKDINFGTVAANTWKHLLNS